MVRWSLTSQVLGACTVQIVSTMCVRASGFHSRRGVKGACVWEGGRCIGATGSRIVHMVRLINWCFGE